VAEVSERRSTTLGGTSRHITIVLAEDQNLVRRSVKCLLEVEEDFAVVGEAADGVKVVGLVKRLEPDVLIVAIAMTGLNGLEVTRQVRQVSPATAVIVLSMYADARYVIQALKNGASGYVVKQAMPTELLRAIRAVVAGRRYLSKPLSDESMATWLRRAQGVTPDPYGPLTGREREVLQLVSEGQNNAHVASRLSISRRTAETHRASVMRKLRLGNQVDLIRYVLARDILVLPGDPLGREGTRATGPSRN
jgi:DNA-binding NarL/FixJ family response regulator